MTSTIKLENGILWISDNKSHFFWDYTSFRPCIKEKINDGNIHKAKIDYVIQNTIDGDEILIPYKIIMNENYLNIRLDYISI